MVRSQGLKLFCFSKLQLFPSTFSHHLGLKNERATLVLNKTEPLAQTDLDAMGLPLFTKSYVYEFLV